MKKTNLSKTKWSAVALATLLTSIATTSVRADIVYVTGCVSNCTATTICGSGINTDINTVISAFVYQDTYSAYTSAKASGTGVADKPATPGSRYFSNGFSNSTPDTAVILSPTLGVPGAVYRLDHTFSSTAGNVSTDVVLGLTNITGCTLSTNTTDKFKASFGAAPNSWSTVCYVTNDPGGANPQIGLYFVGGTVSAGSSARLEFDCFRFVLAQPCLSVNPPSLTGPLAANIGTVIVTGVLSNATNVAVWQDTGSGMVKIASKAVTNPPTSVSVAVSNLVAGAQAGSSQTVDGQESCPPTAGTLVGSGPNTSLRVALSIRGNPTLAGPVWTASSGTNANVYYLGASAVLSGGSAPDDATVIYPSNTWQTVTLQRGPDPLNPINPTVLWNNGASGTPDLQGDFGGLDGIAIACNGDPGDFDIYIDDIANGTNGIVEGYEGLTPGSTVGFSQPSFSGTTAGFLLGAPNQTVIATGVAYTGTNSTRVHWQYVSGATNQWLRLAHSGNSGVANPQVNLNEPISFKLLVVPVGQPPVPGNISFAHTGSNLILNWAGSFPLQSATNVVSSPWTDVGVSTGPYTNAIGGGAKYYRLRSNQ